MSFEDKMNAFLAKSIYTLGNGETTDAVDRVRLKKYEIDLSTMTKGQAYQYLKFDLDHHLQNYKSNAMDLIESKEEIKSKTKEIKIELYKLLKKIHRNSGLPTFLKSKQLVLIYVYMPLLYTLDRFREDYPGLDISDLKINLDGEIFYHESCYGGCYDCALVDDHRISIDSKSYKTGLLYVNCKKDSIDEGLIQAAGYIHYDWHVKKSNQPNHSKRSTAIISNGSLWHLMMYDGTNYELYRNQPYIDLEMIQNEESFVDQANIIDVVYWLLKSTYADSNK